jgi:16S rRNA (guanine527-N7)-methyltransferase
MQASEGLKRLLNEFAISEDSPSALKLGKYLVLLEKWNARVNLTAKTEWEALEPLFREGIWAARMYPAEAGSHLDIGTGAGFPAIVLRIFNPCMNLEIVESRGKKSAFLETVAHELGLKGTQVHSHRLGSLLERSPENKTWDCISWKALRLRTDDLMELCRHANPHTQFWMFHGREEAVEEPNVLCSDFNLVRQEQLPGKRESKLSIYMPRK